MNNHMLRFSDLDLTQLRNLVNDVGKEITLLHAKDADSPTGHEGPKTALDTTWSRLVSLLDLGPEPVSLECPRCKRLNLLGATRCGHCWSVLPAVERKDKQVA